MEYPGSIGLLDSNGEPFPDHIQRALVRLSPRLRREFPVLQDDVALTEVMEEAGRKIAAREARGGPIDRLHGYAWVTLRSIATSHVRRGSIKLIQETLDAAAGAARLAVLPSTSGRAEDIERQVLFAEVLRLLSDDERAIILWRRAGYSSAEIAWVQERTVDAVDKVFSRAKQRIRRALGVESPKRNRRPPAVTPHASDDRDLAETDDPETDDGTS
jgi:DNA-directed RNA polymerase specialized sigma24 family protein